MSAASDHVPVMKEAMLSLVAPKDGGIYVDGTFGGGGYSRALLEAASCVVYGIDRDARALQEDGALSARFDGRLILLHGRFAEMASLLAPHGVNAVDGIVLDLGLSSRQLDDAARGFSFRLDGPLDMRMDQDDPGPNAADLGQRRDGSRAGFDHCQLRRGAPGTCHRAGHRRGARRGPDHPHRPARRNRAAGCGAADP